MNERQTWHAVCAEDRAGRHRIAPALLLPPSVGGEPQLPTSPHPSDVACAAPAEEGLPDHAPRATIQPRTPVLAWSCTWCTCGVWEAEHTSLLGAGVATPIARSEAMGPQDSGRHPQTASASLAIRPCPHHAHKVCILLGALRRHVYVLLLLGLRYGGIERGGGVEAKGAAEAVAGAKEWRRRRQQWAVRGSGGTNVLRYGCGPHLTATLLRRGRHECKTLQPSAWSSPSRGLLPSTCSLGAALMVQVRVDTGRPLWPLHAGSWGSRKPPRRLHLVIACTSSCGRVRSLRAAPRNKNALPPQLPAPRPGRVCERRSPFPTASATPSVLLRQRRWVGLSRHTPPSRAGTAAPSRRPLPQHARSAAADGRAGPAGPAPGSPPSPAAWPPLPATAAYADLCT